ncbi:MAG: helix-turn-helix domain-containing protein [Bacteroidetes bacterium]|nr:helix-turn-helix domain-containing protein [Bacteroidota bacterium]
MKIEYELVQPDEGSSFRVLHNKALAENYAWQYHYHPEYEIACVLRGSGTRHVGNHFSSYENGSLVFLGPNMPHAGFGLNAHGLHEEIVVQVKDDVLNGPLTGRPEMAHIKKLLERSKHGICFLGATKKELTRKLVQLMKLPPFERFIQLMAILHRMAVSNEFELINPAVDFSSLIKKHNSRLERIFTYMENHFHEEINIRDVASVANLSVPSFCNYFKKIMSATFTDFLNQYRIQRACHLLQQEKTIAEVSFECGFNNVAYFNKVFKNLTKRTPSGFKKEMTKNGTYSLSL